GAAAILPRCEGASRKARAQDSRGQVGSVRPPGGRLRATPPRNPAGYGPDPALVRRQGRRGRTGNRTWYHSTVPATGARWQARYIETYITMDELSPSTDRQIRSKPGWTARAVTIYPVEYNGKMVRSLRWKFASNRLRRVRSLPTVEPYLSDL